MKRFCMALLALVMLLGSARAEEDIFAATIATPTPTAGVGSIGLAISEYTYAVISNDTLGVRFSYPSHWVQTPGRRTICYEEPVGEGDIPARMAVSVKQLDDRPDDDELVSQLSAFITVIFTQFDRYEIGNLITDVSFMDKSAYSTIYRGYKGDQVIEGMAILTGVGSKVYLYHFSCSAEDYEAMTPVREYMRSHVEANNA